MKLSLFNQKGKKLNKKVELPSNVFGQKINKTLLNLSVYVYLSNQRKATAHTQKRKEVRGGGAKPWAQKGTGRARHGSIRSPLWKGGGVVFGPRKKRNYKKKMTRNMRKNAIRSAFSYHQKENQVITLDKYKAEDKRFTKNVLKMRDKLPVKENEKLLIVYSGKNDDLNLGARNLKDTNAITTNEINVYTLLDHDKVLIISDAIDEISKLWGSEISDKKGQKKKKIEMEDKKKEKKFQKSKGGKGIESFKFSTRIENALKDADINTKAELEKVIAKEEKIDGIGEKSLEKIKIKLNKE